MPWLASHTRSWCDATIGGAFRCAGLCVEGLALRALGRTPSGGRKPPPTSSGQFSTVMKLGLTLHPACSSHASLSSGQGLLPRGLGLTLHPDCISHVSLSCQA